MALATMAAVAMVAAALIRAGKTVNTTHILISGDDLIHPGDQRSYHVRRARRKHSCPDLQEDW